MLIYIADTNQESELNLYQPNTDIEITEKFFGIFVFNGIEHLTELERVTYKTNAVYKTTQEVYDYWGNRLIVLQDIFDGFADKNITDRIVIGSVPVREIWSK